MTNQIATCDAAPAEAAAQGTPPAPPRKRVLPAKTVLAELLDQSRKEIVRLRLALRDAKLEKQATERARAEAQSHADALECLMAAMGVSGFALRYVLTHVCPEQALSGLGRPRAGSSPPAAGSHGQLALPPVSPS
jgi:hypothetical protein